MFHSGRRYCFVDLVNEKLVGPNNGTESCSLVELVLGALILEWVS